VVACPRPDLLRRHFHSRPGNDRNQISRGEHAQRDGLDYHLAYIPDVFDEISKEMFDPIYMRKLFDLGYQMAKSDFPGTRHRRVSSHSEFSWWVMCIDTMPLFVSVLPK
jgi:hypothetical protein